MLTLSEQTSPHVKSVRATTEGVTVRLEPGIVTDARVPVTVGIPVREGLWPNVTGLQAVDVSSGWATACQVDWSQDREWLRATFLSPPRLDRPRDLLLQPATDVGDEATSIQQSAHTTSLDVGGLKLLFSGNTQGLIDRIVSQNEDFLQPAGLQLEVMQGNGKRQAVRWHAFDVEESGPLRATLRCEGKAYALRVTCRISCYAGQRYIRCELTLHNLRRAKHPGGYWDLGDPGSMLFREVALRADIALEVPTTIQWQEQPSASLKQTPGGSFALHQESSGGENWRSPNHVNRHGEVPLRYRGYRAKTSESEHSGLRASPVVSISDGQRSVTCAVEEFWQKFPTAICVENNDLSIKLWPGECADLHELQAGESCTRVVWLDFRESAASPERLAWIYDPPLATVDPSFIAESQRIPYFPPPATRLRPEYHEILKDSLDGPRNFFAKREAIDEYSWRNFGDMWADHEEAYADDPRPVISHYNNQYDLLHGLLIQYLRTSDKRWWQLADPLARHVMDIDVYRTDRDKPAYNNGLFWHTAHYHTVGRASHRSMSTTMRGKRIPAPGTGPGNEHNYTSGLLLYHQLTGCPRARQTVIQLADWVLAMDDGRRHLLGLLSSEPTGLATCTTDPEYHGPGRGAANSIHALLNAWKLTAADQYIDHASLLIRRTIHPLDDIAARQFDNAELRWSYTVYLQALDRFLLETTDEVEPIEIRAYARQSLLHYARWMAQHERFYLDEPEKLEYPTETWAAQELRKGTTLLMAARYAPATEAAAWRRRAEEIFDQAWQTLISFDSRTCTRPLAVVLQQGHLEASLRTAEAISQQDDHRFDFGSPTDFRTQKQHVKSLPRSPGKLLRALASTLNPARWLSVVNQMWLTERVRRCFD